MIALFKNLKSKLINWALDEHDVKIGELYETSNPQPTKIYDNELKFIGKGTSNFLVKTPTGYCQIKNILKTVKYKKYSVYFTNGSHIDCADNHILITHDGMEVFAKNLYSGLKIASVTGYVVVDYIISKDEYEHMYDLELMDSVKPSKFRKIVLWFTSKFI